MGQIKVHYIDDEQRESVAYVDEHTLVGTNKYTDEEVHLECIEDWTLNAYREKPMPTAPRIQLSGRGAGKMRYAAERVGERCALPVHTALAMMQAGWTYLEVDGKARWEKAL